MVCHHLWIVRRKIQIHKRSKLSFNVYTMILEIFICVFYLIIVSKQNTDILHIFVLNKRNDSVILFCNVIVFDDLWFFNTLFSATFFKFITFRI